MVIISRWYSYWYLYDFLYFLKISEMNENYFYNQKGIMNLIYIHILHISERNPSKAGAILAPSS